MRLKILLLILCLSVMLSCFYIGANVGFDKGRLMGVAERTIYHMKSGFVNCYYTEKFPYKKKVY